MHDVPQPYGIGTSAGTDTGLKHSHSQTYGDLSTTWSVATPALWMCTCLQRCSSRTRQRCFCSAIYVQMGCTCGVCLCCACKQLASVPCPSHCAVQQSARIFSLHRRTKLPIHNLAATFVCHICVSHLCVMLGVCRQFAHVKSVSVVEAYRGRGLGPLLFMELFAAVARLGVPQIRLEAEVRCTENR